jgi:hypothetical protein
MSLIIGFIDNKLTLRGTTVALYDYADFNEKLLGNKSIIITRKFEDVIGEHDVDEKAYSNMLDRFQVVYYKNPKDLDNIVLENKLDVLYIIKSGKNDDNLNTTKCKTIIHCVFETTEPHGTYYCGISEWLNVRNSTNIPVLHHMIHVYDTDNNMRERLGIPSDAIVFGTYGGSDEMESYVRNTILNISSNINHNIYFIFMNITQFVNSPRAIFLKGTNDMKIKREFINTCDAMLYTRIWGETFGLACGEFSICNKPIIAYKNPKDKFHINILTEKILLYESIDECNNILLNFDKYNIDVSANGYKKFTPDYVMNEFKQILSNIL